MARALRYLILNVFSTEPFGGNPLAVFLDAHSLSSNEMQSLARALNLSETCFCLPDSDAARTEDEGTPVRIFTTEEELPFAGHPTLGAATALRLTPGPWFGREQVRLRLGVGTVVVRFSASASGSAENDLPFTLPVRGMMEQRLPVFGRVHAASTIAPLLGLPLEALDPDKPVQTVSTGIGFVIVVLRSAGALAGLRLDGERAAAYLREESGGDGARFFYVLAPDGSDGACWRARMQFYHGEDPATGSAAGCATAYLVHHGYAPAATALRIKQGSEVQRPSLIETSAQLVGDKSAVTTRAEDFRSVRYVRVGGSTVLVAEGRFFLR